MLERRTTTAGAGVAAQTTPLPGALPETFTRPPRGLFREALGRLLRNRAGLFGLTIVVSLVLIAITAPLIAPYSPIEMELSRKLRPPSAQFWLGTDEFGRDILSRMIHGTQISLQVGVIAVGIAMVVGTVIGLVGGYYGGWIDMISQRVIEIKLAFPGLLLALAIIAVFGPSLNNVMIAVGIGAIPTYARLVRGQVLAIKAREYVEAARTIGAGGVRILFLHILPNVLSPLIVLASLGVAGAILAAASLSFIGLGAQPPTPEWGAMLSRGRDYLREEWWVATFPGIAIAITVLAFNLLGDSLRDALDPRQAK